MDGFFPVFIPLKGQPVLLIGGGKVALRRAETLARFGAELTVVAPEILPAFTPLARCLLRPFRPEDVREGYRLVIAASSDREANRTAGERAPGARHPGFGRRREGGVDLFLPGGHRGGRGCRRPHLGRGA